MAGYDNMTFKDAFRAARSNLGSGKTFTWKGKSYKTDTADGKQAAPSARSGASRGASGKAAPAAPMASSPRPKPRPAEAAAAGGAPRVPNTSDKYSPSTEMGFRSQAGSLAPMTSPKPKPRPTVAAPAPAPRPASSAPMTSPKPKARPAELTGAMGGTRRPNADGKYSPTEEMRLRKKPTSAFSKGGKGK